MVWYEPVISLNVSLCGDIRDKCFFCDHITNGLSTFQESVTDHGDFR